MNNQDSIKTLIHILPLFPSFPINIQALYIAYAAKTRYNKFKRIYFTT